MKTVFSTMEIGINNADCEYFNPAAKNYELAQLIV